MKKHANTEKNTQLILSGNLPKAILVLAIPIVINSLLQTMYNLTDTYWLGKIGSDPMAAITLVSPVQNIILNFGQGITVAGAVLISQYIGAGDKKNAKLITNPLFVCSMLFSLFCVLTCFLATPAILRWMGADGVIFEYSKIYLQIVILDMPFLYMINLYTSVHQAQGDTITPMLLNLLGIVLNLILDPLMLIVLEMGIAGAAIATLVAKIPCAVIAFISLLKKTQDIHLDATQFPLQKDKLSSIIRIGLPTAIGGSTMQFGFLLMSKNVLKYGTLAVTAYGIGNRINSLITMPSNAMGSATATIVGQNIGAGRKPRAKQAYLIAMGMAAAFLFTGGLILSRERISISIVSIFSADADVIAMASDFLRVMALWCFTNSAYHMTIGLFQGTGHTVINMAVDASRLWIFRFATLFFCENILLMGVRSIWYSVVVSNALSSLLLLILYKCRLWEKDVVQISSHSRQS